MALLDGGMLKRQKSWVKVILFIFLCVCVYVDAWLVRTILFRIIRDIQLLGPNPSLIFDVCFCGSSVGSNSITLKGNSLIQPSNTGM